jgi:hypothetical protein
MGDHPLHPHDGEEPEPADEASGDAEIEALVAGTPLPPVRGDFRDQVRAGFLQGTLRAALPMDSSIDEQETPSRAGESDRKAPADVKDLQEIVARTPLAQPARTEFRAELRQQFLTGDFPQGQSFDSGEPEPAGKLLRFLLPVAAVAAILLVTFLAPGLFGERVWHAQVLGEGSVEVAGLSLGSHEEARIGVEATLGGPIVVGDSKLRLELADHLVLEIQPETTLTLNALPDTGSGERLVVRIDRGEAYLKTLDEGLDFPVLFTTEEAWVTVVGTTLGVMAGEEGTCVCVSEGEVDVRNRTATDSDAVDVGQDRTYFIFRGAAMQPKDVAFGMDPDHTGPLVKFMNE